MIQHIYEDLLTKLDSYKFKQGSDVWAEWVANELLDMIEGFGMKPPYNDSLKYLYHHQIDMCQWESEDE